MKLLRCVLTIIIVVLSIHVYAMPDTIPITYYDKTELNQMRLKAIFLGRQSSWKDGTDIKVFIFPYKSPQHKEFCKKVLGMFAYQFEDMWMRRVYSGTGIPPVIVNSKEEMESKLNSVKGSIGYLEM